MRSKTSSASPLAVDLDEVAPVTEVIDHGFGVLVEHFESLAGGLLGVVVALDQLAAALVVTDARLLGRLEVDVKVRAAVVADTATGESVDEHFLVDVVEDHGVEIRDLREVLRLVEVARVAVEHEPVGVRQRGLDDLVDDRVRDELPASMNDRGVPYSVSMSLFARSASPVVTCSTSYSSASFALCVPFRRPAPPAEGFDDSYRSARPPHVKA